VPVDLKASVNLPRTSFPMKANLPQNEPKTLARWEEMRLYDRIRQARKGVPQYVLHDGPPYANGPIHLGHALNKCLKDFVVKSKNMAGFDAPYIPGWDCHGLPIEIKVDQQLGGKKLQIPFDLFVVFATNLDPATVVEEAFLRRIQTKINLGPLTSEQFHEIFRRSCANASLTYDKALIDDVMRRVEHEYEQPLRACQPNDLVNQILWRAKYEQKKPALTLEALADAWVQRPNNNPLFGGLTPLEYMIRGGLPAMQNVRRLLDARRAG